jgi:hypothetical protein
MEDDRPVSKDRAGLVIVMIKFTMSGKNKGPIALR